MQLFDNPASPFCRKVNVLLHELDQTEAVTLNAAGGHPTMADAKMPLDANPLGKIPVLVRDDGPALYDSRVICRYLNDRFSGRFYPENRIWEILTLEATADGIMEAAVLMVYEGRSRPEEMQYQPWVEAQWTKITRALDALEDRWLSHLEGHFDQGASATAIALEYLDFRQSDRDWRAGRPGLANWQARIAERASLQATQPRNA